jgi:hypothetical protein
MADSISAFDISGSSVGTSSAVALCLTQAGNFARIEVVPNGGLLYSTSGHKKITVNVWVQPTTGWGYVGRPSANRGGTIVAKKVSNTIVRQ